MRRKRGQPEPPFLVVDIGGGSTEFVLGSPGDGADLAAISMNIGCVRLTERHFQADPPTQAQVAAATADIDAALAKAALAPCPPPGRTLWSAWPAR